MPYILVSRATSRAAIWSSRPTTITHHLMHTDGTPFFYLADTLWYGPSHLSREDIDLYLENRRLKGFTVIQAMLGNGWDHSVPNFYGNTTTSTAQPDSRHG
jgi:hypothetical protein